MMVDFQREQRGGRRINRMMNQTMKETMNEFTKNQSVPSVLPAM